MSKNKLVYEGKAKILYEGPEPGTLIQHFKDDTTAGNGEKFAVISGKGVINNRISEYIMTGLEQVGIHTHFIKSLNMREQLIKAAEMIPLEVVVRNVTAGSLAKRFGVEEGMMMPRPILEFYMKSDKLGDPMITDEHIIAFNIAMQEELNEIKSLALRINDFLAGLFKAVNIRLVDFKVEFGRIYDEEGNLYIILADEVSPDSCRLWDIKTNEKMDKDRFRRDLGGVEEAYKEVARRLGILGSPGEEIKFQQTKPKPVKSGAKKVTNEKETDKKEVANNYQKPEENKEE